MAELYLPVLSHFQNGNIWLASIGRLRFRVAPGERLDVETWEDPWCYDLSRVEGCASFPLEDEGIEATKLWLLEQAEQMNQRPARTLAENAARKVTSTE